MSSLATAALVVMTHDASLDDDLPESDDFLAPAAPAAPAAPPPSRRAASRKADEKRVAAEEITLQQELDDTKAARKSKLATKKANIIRLQNAQHRLQPTLRILFKGFDTLSVLPNGRILKLDESAHAGADLLMKVVKKHHARIAKSAVVAF